MLPRWFWIQKARNEQRKRILKRDKYRCQVCGYCPSLVIIGKKKRLNIHHMDRNERNNNDSNLMTLCSSCHAKAHREYVRESSSGSIGKLGGR